MNKEQQDLSWACLPKEVRKEIRRKYKIAENNIYLFIQTFILEDIFGIDNLTSDTEPEEMLMIERQRVQNMYDYNDDILLTDPTHKGAKLLAAKLKELFGDKCLPNKEPSVQVEPKFRKGDLVKCKTDGIIYKVKRKSGLYHYHLKGKDNPVHINWLEPYTEPETKDNMEKNRCEKCKANAQQCVDSPCQDYPLEEKELGKEDNFTTKELNLCELLKGYEGEWFYVTPCGEMELKGINKLELKPLHFSRDAINCLTKTDGRAYENGSCIIYPSRALYEKYPLDAYSAWMEWKEARKPKRWRAEKGENYWWIDLACGTRLDNDIRDSCDDLCYENFNYFRTEDLAQQASEAVRECLEKFHESKNE